MCAFKSRKSNLSSEIFNPVAFTCKYPDSIDGIIVNKLLGFYGSDRGWKYKCSRGSSWLVERHASHCFEVALLNSYTYTHGCTI